MSPSFVLSSSATRLRACVRWSLFVAVSWSSAMAHGQTLTGLWEFGNSGNLAAATVGANLTINGTTPTWVSTQTYGSTALDGVITTIGGTANNLLADPGIGANGGGSRTNEYTFVFDMSRPPANLYKSLFSTDLTNASDAEYFIRPSNFNMGRTSTIGYSSGSLTADTWYRYVISADLGSFYRAYSDGSLFHTHSTPAIDNGDYSLNLSGVLFFADNNSENQPLVIGSVAVYNGALSAAQVSQLGSAGAAYALRPLTWAGSPGNATWNTAATNWTWTNAPVSTAFVANDTVTFDDSATVGAIDIPAAVATNGVRFDNASLTYSLTGAGSLAVAGNVVKAGTGTVSLGVATTVTGATSITGGTLEVGTGGTAGSLTGNVAVASGATLAVNRSDAITVGGTISGNGSLRKSGGGALTLSGTNTFSGGTTWDAGNISIANGSGLGTGTVTMNGTAARTLTVANTAAQTLPTGIVLPNPGSATTYTIVKNSSGQTTGTNLDLTGIISGGGPNATLFFNSSVGGDNTTSYTLSGANTFVGTININRGALVVANASGLGNSTNLVRLNSNQNTSLGNLRFTLPMTVPNPIALQATYPINTNEHAITAEGVISGSGALRKLGTGTLSLAATNTYSGGTIIDAGTLAIGNGGTTGSISGNVTNSATLAFNRSDAISFGGVISGSGAVRQLAAGTTTLTAANTYGGGTFVEAGTLALGAAASLASPAIVVSPGATFDVSSLAGGFTLGSGQSLGGSGTVAGALAVGSGGTLSPGMSPGTLTTGPLTWQAGGNYNWQIVSTAGTAGSQWDLISADSLTLSGLSVLNPFAINLWSLASTGPDVNGPVADFNPAVAGSWRIVNSAETISGFDPSHFTLSTAATNGTGGFSNSLLGGSFSLALTGDSLGLDLLFTPGQTLTWTADGVTPGGSGNWSDSGETWDDGSSVVAWNSAKTAIFSGSPGTVTVDGSLTASKGLDFTIDGYTVDGGTLTLGGASATINEVAVASGATATLAATLGGTSGATKTGLGTLAITTPATITGGVTVAAGTLRVGDGATGGSLATDVTVDAGGTLVFNRSDAATFADGISGSGSVRQEGTGTLALSGTNSFSGPLVVAAGSVSVASDASLGAVPGSPTPGQLVLADTTLATTASFTMATARGVAIGPNVGSGSGTIDVASGTTLSYAGAIANNGTAGTLVKSGPGTLALSGTSTYSGGTRLTAGRLEFASGSAIGTGIVTFEGGTLAYTGPTGTVTRTMNVANESSFDVPTGVQLTWTGNIQGTSGRPASDGKLVKTGAGTLLVNGNFDNQVNGIRVAEGTLVSQHGTNYFLLGYLRGTGGQPDGSPLEIAAAGTVRIDGIDQLQGGVTRYNTVTYSNTPIVLEGGQLVFVAPSSGTRNNTVGSLSFTAGGSVSIEANHRVDLNSLGGIATSGTGAATISGPGTLNIVKRAVGDTPTIDVAAAAPLTISTAITSTAFGNSTGGLGLTKTGLGTLTLAGANTYAGATFIEEGTLALGPAASLATASIQVSSGATFDVSAIVGGFALASGQSISGAGTILGNLEFDSGSQFVFGETDTLAMGNGTLSFASGFGVANISGLSSTTPLGTYVLFSGAVNSAGLANLGPTQPYDLGVGVSAYFQVNSLELVVVPEPGTWALAAVGVAAVAALRFRRRRGEK